MRNAGSLPIEYNLLLNQMVWTPYWFTECNRSFLREVSARTTCLTLKNEGKFYFLHCFGPNIFNISTQKGSLDFSKPDWKEKIYHRSIKFVKFQSKKSLKYNVLQACNTHVTTWAMGEAFLENVYFTSHFYSWNPYKKI